MRNAARGRLSSYALAVVLTVGLVAVWAVPGADEPDWPTILGAPQGSIPAPQEAIVWRDDIYKALDEAKQTNRPVFAVLRCPPCKQCSAFDKQLLDGSPALDPLLAQFITVRILKATDLNFNLFKSDDFQDYDLSLWGYFFSPEGRIYSVFGGKDVDGDTTRISEASLCTQMKRVLAHHHDPRRAAWDIDGPLPDLESKPDTPKDLPGFAAWFETHGNALKTPPDYVEQVGPECVHCHMIADIKRLPAIKAGTFDVKRDIYVWPYPENVGLVVDRDDGLRVTKVTADGPAARAGIQVGDSLAMAGGRKLFSQTDFRAVLHRGPQADGVIPVAWIRAGQAQFGELKVADGWRVSNLDWRTTMAGGAFGAGPSFWPLAASPNDRQSRGIAADGMAIRPFFGRNPSGPAYAAGIRPDDVIVAVNGQNPDKNGRGWLIWFKLQYQAGDTVTMTAVNRQGQRREVSYTLVAPME